MWLGQAENESMLAPTLCGLFFADKCRKVNFRHSLKLLEATYKASCTVEGDKEREMQ